MKLAEPILGAGGSTLMPAGIRLTPMFLARIRKWNIEALDVFADSAPADAAPEDTSASARRKASVRRSGLVTGDREAFAHAVAADIARVFSNVRENPLMMQLRSIVIRHLVERGPDSSVGALRRGPVDELPLPIGEGG